MKRIFKKTLFVFMNILLAQSYSVQASPFGAVGLKTVMTAALNKIITPTYIFGKNLFTIIVKGLALYGGGTLLLNQRIVQPLCDAPSSEVTIPNPPPTDTSNALLPSEAPLLNLPPFPEGPGLGLPPTPVDPPVLPLSDAPPGMFDFLKPYNPLTIAKNSLEWASIKKAAAADWIFEKKCNAQSWVFEKKCNAQELMLKKTAFIRNNPKTSAAVATWVVAGFIYEKYYKKYVKACIVLKMTQGIEDERSQSTVYGNTWNECQIILRNNSYINTTIGNAQEYINRINNGSLSVPEYRFLWWLFLLHPYSVYKKMSR